MKMPLCQQALTCPHGYSESPADGQAVGQAVGVYRVTSPGLDGAAVTLCACLLNIWNKEASLGLPSVFTALLFFHTPRKILPKHTFQTHQLNMGGKKYTIFFHCKSCPQYQGRRAEQQKLEAGMDQWGRQEGGSDSREREKILSGWVADMAHEFN